LNFVQLTHLRFLTELFLSIPPQRQILLNDLREVYHYFIDNLDLLRENEELAQTILFALRDEQLFLNIDEEGDQLNWVQGSSLAFDCNVREGSIQDVRKFLRPFEKILVAAGALRVQHPSYTPERNTQQSESEKLQNIWSSFDQLRKEKAYIDVEFIAHATDDPNPEPLFAHRVFLAASSDYFKDYFRGDFMESRSASQGGLHTLQVEFSWQCVRSFLGGYWHPFFNHVVLTFTSDYIYTGSKGDNISLELLLELLHLSNYYHITDLFDEVQGEIITRRLLRPDTVDRGESS
jgi:sacsin